MTRRTNSLVLAWFVGSCTSHGGAPPERREPAPESQHPEPSPVSGAAAAGSWVVPIGNAGVQWPGSAVLAPDGTTYLVTQVSLGCTTVTLPTPAELCGQDSVLGLSLLVAHAPDGSMRFARRVDDARRWWVNDIALLADGRIALLTGPRRQLHGEPPVPTGDDRTRVRILDPEDGALLDSIDLDLDATPGAGSLTAVGDGDFLVTGVFAGELRVGEQRLVGDQDGDVFLARFDARGRARWGSTARGTTPGLSGQDTMNAVHVLDDGSILALGGCRGRPLRFEGGGRRAEMTCGGRRRDDAFVSKWRDDGTLLWTRHLRGTSSGSPWSGLGASPHAIAELAGGGIIVAGAFSHTVALESPSKTVKLAGRGFSDVFLAHYSGEGELRDAWQIGGPGQDSIAGLRADGDAVWMIGSTAGDGVLAADWRPSQRFLDHDPENLHLEQHAFLLRFDPAHDTRHVLGMHASSASHLAAVQPAAILATDQHVRIAGSFNDAAARFPLPGQDAVTIERRVEPRLTYESFLWATTWERLHAQVAALPHGGALESSTPPSPPDGVSRRAAQRGG